MNLKRITSTVLAGIVLAGVGTVAPVYAIGNIWTDEHAEIQAKQYKKVVLFPIRDRNESEGSFDENQGYNEYFYKELKKHVNKTNILGFGDMLKEKKHILRDNASYKNLTGHFDSEADRAKAVYDATAADGYLIPHIRWAQERVDTSPATWTRVKMESYYDIDDGPNGDEHKLNYQSWWQDHLIPEHQSTLQMLDMDFILYDAYTGKKAMTRIDYYRNYNVDQRHALKRIGRGLAKDWAKLRKDKDNNVPANALTLGFRNFTLPDSAGNDEFAIKTIYYAIKDEAGDTLKRVKVDYSPNGGQYYVTGDVTYYNRGETWNPPSASAYPHCYNTQKFQWTDDKGNIHTGERKYYKTTNDDISDHFGFYSFWYKVGMDLRLVNASKGEVVYEKYAEASDPDFYADALRSILHDFYKQVDKLIGVEEN